MKSSFSIDAIGRRYLSETDGSTDKCVNYSEEWGQKIFLLFLILNGLSPIFLRVTRTNQFEVIFVLNVDNYFQVLIIVTVKVHDWICCGYQIIVALVDKNHFFWTYTTESTVYSLTFLLSTYQACTFFSITSWTLDFTFSNPAKPIPAWTISMKRGSSLFRILRSALWEVKNTWFFRLRFDEEILFRSICIPFV